MLAVVAGLAVGWLAGVLAGFLLAAAAILLQPHRAAFGALIAAPLVVAIGSLYFILPALLAMLPLCLLFPASSPVWRCPVSTSIGVLAGIAIVTVVLCRPGTNPPESILSWYILSTAIGGTSGSVAALVHQRLRARI